VIVFRNCLKTRRNSIQAWPLSRHGFNFLNWKFELSHCPALEL